MIDDQLIKLEHESEHYLRKCYWIIMGSVTPENSLSGHILQGTDFFFINLTRLYGNSRSGTGNPKQGTKCTLSIESRFVNPEMLIIKLETCQTILQVNLIS